MGEQFAHTYNVWLIWLSATAPDLLDGLFELEKGAITQELLAIELAKNRPGCGQVIVGRF